MALDMGEESVIENTIIASGIGGEAISCVDPAPTMRCCDLYGNETGDWFGCIEHLLGIDGNISEDPLFCDPQNEDLTLHSDSPCAWANNPECGYIGAWPVGCGETASTEAGGNSGRISTQIFPNPTTGHITIDFDLPTTGQVSTRILDVSGRVVRHLFDGTYPQIYAGEFSLAWDGLDDAGRMAAPGVYFVSLRTATRSLSRPIVLLR
jgi:hypothetical protein